MSRSKSQKLSDINRRLRRMSDSADDIRYQLADLISGLDDYAEISRNLDMVQAELGAASALISEELWKRRSVHCGADDPE